MKRVILCYTGGKDSTVTMHLLLHKPKDYSSYLNQSEQMSKILNLNSQFKFTSLVTFHPENPAFLSHPVPLLTKIGKATSLDHKFIQISGPDFLDSYATAIKKLDIDVLVTGDMEDVCSKFMNRVAEKAGVELWCPLWKIDRDNVYKLALDEFKLEMYITCVNITKFVGFEEEAKLLVGKKIDWDTVSFFKRVFEKIGMDICGEKGEFHSMCLNGPLFIEKIPFPVNWVPKITEDGQFCYADIFPSVLV